MRRPALPRRLVLAAGLALVASGCATTSRSLSADEARAEGWARVEDVAEVRQSGEHDCGAAALAMVLRKWGQPVTPQEIWAASPPEPGHGLRADVLRDYARGRGLQAFLVEGRPDDLDRELGRGRPVLVGVVKKKGRRTYPHYEVVVGMNRARQRVLTLDPARGASESSLERFTAEWDAAGRVTLVVFSPAGGTPRAGAPSP